MVYIYKLNKARMWDFDGVVNVQVVFEINTIQITKLIHYRVMHGQDYSL